MKSHESGLFLGLLTHSYFSQMFFKRYLWKKKIRSSEIDGKDINLVGIVPITYQTSYERGGTLDASVSPRSRSKASALFEKIISRSRSIIAPSERRAGCLLERIVVLAADNYHFAAKLVWNLYRRNGDMKFHPSRFNLISQLGLTVCSSTVIVIYFCHNI